MSTPELTYKLTSLNTQSLRPDCIIWRDKDNQQIGLLSWKAGVFKFEGEVEQSAKLFFDYLSTTIGFPKDAAPAPTFAQLYKN